METDKTCSIHREAGIELIITPEIKHYGKFVCKECGKFVVWAKTPTTSYALVDRQTEIVRLLRLNGRTLNERDVIMLCKLYSIVHLTDLQRQSWERLRGDK